MCAEGENECKGVGWGAQKHGERKASFSYYGGNLKGVGMCVRDGWGEGVYLYKDHLFHQERRREKRKTKNTD